MEEVTCLWLCYERMIDFLFVLYGIEHSWLYLV